MKKCSSGVYRQTVKSAKKAELIISIITMIIAVGIEVLYLVIKSDWKYLPMVFGIFLFIFSIVEFFKNLARIKRSSCPNCDLVYNYNDDVAWHVVGVTYQPGDTKASIVVEFCCSCANCGKDKIFQHEFTCAKFDEEKGEWDYESNKKLADKIRDYLYI